MTDFRTIFLSDLSVLLRKSLSRVSYNSNYPRDEKDESKNNSLVLEKNAEIEIQKI